MPQHSSVAAARAVRAPDGRGRRSVSHAWPHASCPAWGSPPPAMPMSPHACHGSMRTVAEGGVLSVQAFMRERLNIMRLPARTGRSDAFELRVLAHLSTVRGRRVRPAGTTGKRSLRPRFGVGASFPSYGATPCRPSPSGLFHS